LAPRVRSVKGPVVGYETRHRSHWDPAESARWQMGQARERAGMAEGVAPADAAQAALGCGSWAAVGARVGREEEDVAARVRVPSARDAGEAADGSGLSRAGKLRAHLV